MKQVGAHLWEKGGMTMIWPRGYKKNSCSAELSMKVFLAINVKMPTSVGILILMSRKTSILDLKSLKNAEYLDIFVSISI